MNREHMINLLSELGSVVKIMEDNDMFIEELTELKCEILKIKKLLKIVGRVELGKSYFYIDDSGVIKIEVERNNEIDDFRYSIGNYFKTEQKAQDYKENLITKQRLKDLALRLNNGVEIGWEDTSQKKCSLYISGNSIMSRPTYNQIDVGQVYCLSSTFLIEAKQEIGEQALIKLIKSGV